MASRKQAKDEQADAPVRDQPATGNDQSSTSLVQAREEMAERQRERAAEREKAGDQAEGLAKEAAETGGQHGDPSKDYNSDLVAAGEGPRIHSGADPMDPRTNAKAGWFSDEDPRTLAGYDPLKDAAPGANTGKNHKPGTGQDLGKEVAGKVYENEILGSDAGVRTRHAARDGRFDVDDAMKSNDPDFVPQRREAGKDGRNEIAAQQRDQDLRTQ